jgi:cobalt/nickel transport system permease protein
MTRRRLSIAAFVAVGLLIAVLLVVFVAPHASSSPDGLEKVAADKGINRDVRPSAVADGPLADYGVKGVDHAALGTIVAGLVGVAVTFVIVLGAMWLLRRRRARPEAEPVAG